MLCDMNTDRHHVRLVVAHLNLGALSMQQQVRIFRSHCFTYNIRCTARASTWHKAIWPCCQNLHGLASHLQMCLELGMASMHEPLKHAQHGLEALHAGQVQDAQVGPLHRHQAACNAECWLLGHVHQQQARHKCHSLAVPHLQHARLVLMCSGPQEVKASS